MRSLTVTTTFHLQLFSHAARVVVLLNLQVECEMCESLPSVKCTQCGSLIPKWIIYTQSWYYTRLLQYILGSKEQNDLRDYFAMKANSEFQTRGFTKVFFKGISLLIFFQLIDISIY